MMPPKGVCLPSEVKERIRLGTIRRWEATRTANGGVIPGYPRSDETKRKIGDATRGVPRTAQDRQKISDGQYRRWAKKKSERVVANPGFFSGSPAMHYATLKPPDGMVWAYLISNVATGRSYVGITTETVRRRWRGHLTKSDKPSALGAAIRKYGEGAFLVYPLFLAWNWSIACEVERELISTLNTRAPAGYNLTDGGDGAPGVVHTEDRRAIRSAQQKAYMANPLARVNVSNKLAGKPKSADHVRKVSASLIARNRVTST